MKNKTYIYIFFTNNINKAYKYLFYFGRRDYFMRWIRGLGKIFGILLLLFLIFNIVLYTYCFITPKISLNKDQSYYLYDNENTLIFNDSEDWIKLENISPYLIDATIYTEDKLFYKHLGFDYLRILKAALNNVKSIDIKNKVITFVDDTTTELLSRNHIKDVKNYANNGVH